MRGLIVEELRSGSGTTLFVIGGAGGATDELVHLAAGFTGDVRVVALAAVADQNDTMESMAAAVAGAVRAEQRDGPYHLLGYSFGGLLALEAAELLEDHGVAFLGLIDALFDQRHWPTGLFVRAIVERSLVHARGLLDQPPADAWRELTGRSSRLARRLRGRHRSPLSSATGPDEPPSAQAANLAVLARWRPRVLQRPVTLFAATEADFGVDLEALWRPWLPMLEVRRVRGDHLDLLQTSAGGARLARAVSRELGHPGRLHVMVASTFRWPGAARLAQSLHEAGCVVTAVAPRGSALHSHSDVEHGYRLGLADPLRSLRGAIEEARPDLVVPFDDRTRQALTMLHARCARGGTTDALAELLERSLGSPAHYAAAYSRAEVLAIAQEAGVHGPPSTAVTCAEDIAGWLRLHPGPAVLKTDGSWGGRGVVEARNEAEALSAWRRLHRRPSLARALARLVRVRDPWELRAWIRRARPAVCIQQYVAGCVTTASVACFQGTALSVVQAAVVESDGPTGPSTVVRIIDNADMAYAVKSLVAHLELSGLCGFDFILDEDGRAHLLEINPRATPTAHVVGPGGSDLLAALQNAYGSTPRIPREPATLGELVALFPKGPVRDRSRSRSQVAPVRISGYAPGSIDRAPFCPGAGTTTPLPLTSIAAADADGP